MEKEKTLQKISDGLSSIEEQLKKRISSYSDANINMKENLESLQASVQEIDKYIGIIKKDIEDEDNIFFLGMGSQENQRKLENQEKNKDDLENHIKDLKETIVVEEEKRKFLEDISSEIFEYDNMIKNFIGEKNDKKINILEKLKVCQKLSKIDHERCYIEIGKIIEEVEKWEKE